MGCERSSFHSIGKALHVGLGTVRSTSRAFNSKVRNAIRVHKSIVVCRDTAKMLATYWRGLEVIPTYADHLHLVTYA